MSKITWVWLSLRPGNHHQEHVPGTEKCVPCVPKIENPFPQKFCLRVPVGKPSFREIESIALQFWDNDYIFIKAHILISFDLQLLVIFMGS